MTNKTDEILKLTAPYSNPYQGLDTRMLFVCSAGLLRSATAQNLFAKKGYNTRGCGSGEYALIPLSYNLLAWADYVFFMMEDNKEQARRTFAKDRGARRLVEKGIVLNIPDHFAYNDKELIRLLKERVSL